MLKGWEEVKRCELFWVWSLDNKKNERAVTVGL
jgi:hypothetical protein